MNNNESISDREKQILKFWSDNDIFKKTESPLDDESWFKNIFNFNKKKQFVFFDGPPFANGKPHYGHLLVGIIKDCIPRYKTMRGYQVSRKWGWDCHGLPIEYEIEKEMNIKSKKEIEEVIGIEKFNRAARESVLKHAEVWKQYVERVGRWVDMDSAYRTMDAEYIESTWNMLGRIYNQGLMQKSFDVLHICPRCETTVSNAEVSQGYKDIKDISVYVKFQIEDTNEFFLVWTTTPWTLFGNTALAINKDLTYAKVKDGDDILIIEETLLKGILPETDVIETVKGEKFIGKKYKPPFLNLYDENHKSGWRVYHGDFVTNLGGTAVVHIAPAFGTDDFTLFEKYSLPIIRHIDFTGRFKEEIKELAGVRGESKG